MSRPRCYDHDEARRLYGEGVSVRELSARFGVSKTSIRYAVIPGEAEKIRVRGKNWHLRQGNTCVDCGKPITHPRGAMTKRPYKRCVVCAGVARRKVTDTEMRCCTCKQWKPDDEFFPSTGDDGLARRGRSRTCKACAVERRRNQRYRDRRPCVNGCGAMVNSSRDNKTGLCLSCAMKAVRRRAKAS